MTAFESRYQDRKTEEPLEVSLKKSLQTTANKCRRAAYGIGAGFTVCVGTATYVQKAGANPFFPQGGAAVPKLIGLVCALVALAASVLASVDIAGALIRAVLAFLAGWVLTQVWYVFFATQVASTPTEPAESDEEAA